MTSDWELFEMTGSRELCEFKRSLSAFLKKSSSLWFCGTLTRRFCTDHWGEYKCRGQQRGWWCLQAIKA